MLNKALEKGLYAITDCANHDTETLLGKSEIILKAGAVILQYRDKSVDQSIRHDRACALQAMCSRHGVVFLINDDIRLASEIAADGVHIGKDDAEVETARNLLGPETVIGVSCYNNLDIALDAQARGANYVAFGAFYPTQTKEKTVKVSAQLLTQAKKKLSIPIVAIGGINPENGQSLVSAGADMLAVVNSIYSVEDPQQITKQFNQLFIQETSG